MFKKMIVGLLVLATSTVFGMSLSQLNSASKKELMEINGIGEVKADAILKERRKGKFKSFEDFQRVEGIGEQTAANLKNNVKSSDDVKTVKKKTKKKTAKTNAAKKTKSSKPVTKEKKKRKIKTADEKKKELKKKPKKTKQKKTKEKKSRKNENKKTKSKN